MSTKLKLMGVDVASIGDAHGKTPKSRAYQYVNEPKQIYKKIVVSEDGKQLLGAVLVGDATEYGTLLQMALNGIQLPADPEFLILPSSDGKAKPGLGVDALPDSAQICSCNNVTKGTICAAVGDGACTTAELKACTKAGASCGGCVPLVGPGDEGRDGQARPGGRQPPLRALRLLAPGAVSTWSASARSAASRS